MAIHGRKGVFVCLTIPTLHTGAVRLLRKHEAERYKTWMRLANLLVHMRSEAYRTRLRGVAKGLHPCRDWGFLTDDEGDY
jgi:hypothetical protein